jgi:hypothetical protein
VTYRVITYAKRVITYAKRVITYAKRLDETEYVPTPVITEVGFHAGMAVPRCPAVRRYAGRSETSRQQRH